MWKVLAIIGALCAVLSVSFALVKYGEKAGKNACENQYLTADNQALIESTSKIIGALDGYEKAIQEIGVLPLDKTPVPVPIKRVIDILPEPKQTATKR